MKIAYLIIAHTDPKQCSNLISALDSECAHFFVHVDKKVELRPFLENIRTTKSHLVYVKERNEVYWGGYSVVRATIKLISNAVNSGIRFHKYVLMSGVDYPIKSCSYIQNKLFRDDKDYIDFFTLPGLCWESQRGGLDRIRFYHFNDYKLTNPRSKLLIGRMVGGISKKYGEYFPRKIPRGWTIYGGHQFWALSHSSVQYILESIEKYPEIVRFFKWTYVPDESFFQTILLNSDRRDNLVNDHLRFVLWEREDPAVFVDEDYDSIVQSKALFARKFDSIRSRSLIHRINRDILDLPSGVGPAGF